MTTALDVVFYAALGVGAVVVLIYLFGRWR
jgi:hypothetical protein